MCVPMCCACGGGGGATLYTLNVQLNVYKISVYANLI